MACMQIAHGGHENNAGMIFQGSAQVGDGGVNLHKTFKTLATKKREKAMRKETIPLPSVQFFSLCLRCERINNNVPGLGNCRP